MQCPMGEWKIQRQPERHRVRKVVTSTLHPLHASDLCLSFPSLEPVQETFFFLFLPLILDSMKQSSLSNYSGICVAVIWAAPLNIAPNSLMVLLLLELFRGTAETLGS